MRAYKWLADEDPIYGTGKYDLSGAWQTVTGKLKICKLGYHVCNAEQVPYFCGTVLWEVEVDGKCIVDDIKSCWQRIRFVRKMAWSRKDLIDYVNFCFSEVKNAASAACACACACACAAAENASDSSSTASAAFPSYSTASAAFPSYYAASAAFLSYYAASACAADAASVSVAASIAASDAASAAAYAAADAENAALRERKKQRTWIETRIGEKFLTD